MGNEYYYSGGMESFGVFSGEEAAVAGVFGVVFFVYGLIVLFALAFSVATYVLHSLGLYTVAQRRKIRRPWLAWVPVGNVWLLGSISDQYQYLAKGTVKNRRIMMLGFNIAAVALYFVWLFSMLLCVLLEEVGGAAAAGTVAVMLFATFALFAAVIVLAVFEYMCYYDLYRSCERTNGMLYLILSIVFSFIIPFLVFACRKKDDGMPLRKQPAPAEAPIEVVAEDITDPEGEPDNEQEAPVADT